MGRHIPVSLAIVFCMSIAWGQNCLSAGITLETQAQVDAFPAGYPGCTTIDGDLEIIGDLITNLDSLYVLTSVGGDLIIENTTALTSLTGLHNITSVGADFDIVDNAALTSLDGLSGLVSTGGDLTVEYNARLQDLTGLENVTTIGQDLDIIGNDSLTSISELTSLTSVGAVITVEDNTTLSACAVPSTCDQLGAGAAASFANNADGCNSLAEVDSICGTDAARRSNRVVHDGIAVHTNRLAGTIAIATGGTGHWRARVYNSQGQLCTEGRFRSGTGELDMAGLTGAVYCIELHLGNGRQVTRTATW